VKVSIAVKGLMAKLILG